MVKIGKYDIRDAAKIWEEYNMEIVPIVNENYINKLKENLYYNRRYKYVKKIKNEG